MLRLLLAALSLIAGSSASCIFDGSNLRMRAATRSRAHPLQGNRSPCTSPASGAPSAPLPPALKEFYATNGTMTSHWSLSAATTAPKRRRSTTSGRLQGSWKFNWLELAWGDPLAAQLKRKHRVWSGREVETFGYKRRSGVPCVAVIDPEGNELSFLQGSGMARRFFANGSPTTARQRGPMSSSAATA